MKSENITKALHDADFAAASIAAAYREAIAAGDEFADMILEIALRDAHKLSALLTRIQDAATKGRK